MPDQRPMTTCRTRTTRSAWPAPSTQRGSHWPCNIMIVLCNVAEPSAEMYLWKFCPPIWQQFAKFLGRENFSTYGIRIHPTTNVTDLEIILLYLWTLRNTAYWRQFFIAWISWPTARWSALKRNRGCTSWCNTSGRMTVTFWANKGNKAGSQWTKIRPAFRFIQVFFVWITRASRTLLLP